MTLGSHNSDQEMNELQRYLLQAGADGRATADIRQGRLSRAQLQGEVAVYKLRQDFNVERSIDRPHYALVGNDQWWNEATPKAIATAYEHAVSWAPFNEEADRVSGAILEQVKQRFELPSVDAPVRVDESTLATHNRAAISQAVPATSAVAHGVSSGPLSGSRNPAQLSQVRSNDGFSR